LKFVEEGHIKDVLKDTAIKMQDQKMTGDEMTDQKVVCHFSVLHFPLPHNCFSLYVIVQTVRKDKAVGPSAPTLVYPVPLPAK